MWQKKIKDTTLLNDGAKRNRFPYLKILEKSYICTFLVTFLALKLIATCNIKHLNSKCLNVIGIGSIKNLNTGSYFCTFFGDFSSTKVDSNM